MQACRKGCIFKAGSLCDIIDFLIAALLYINICSRIFTVIDTVALSNKGRIVSGEDSEKALEGWG
jgi:hypothetical protein